MIFPFLLYYELAHSIGAGIILPINGRSFEQNSCTDLTLCRSICNIVWICIVTIFSCTWVAGVYPNILCPGKRVSNRSPPAMHHSSSPQCSSTLSVTLTGTLRLHAALEGMVSLTRMWIVCTIDPHRSRQLHINGMTQMN